MNRRPVCAAANQAQCLASSVATGTALTTPYVVSANAWASDNALAYDFGVQHPDGTQCAARFGMTLPRSAPMLSPDAGTPSAFCWEVFDELLRLMWNLVMRSRSRAMTSGPCYKAISLSPPNLLHARLRIRTRQTCCARARDAYVMNSGSASYTFSSLPAGDPASQYMTVLYACVRDSYGASNCTTTSVTVRAPPRRLAPHALAVPNA